MNQIPLIYRMPPIARTWMRCCRWWEEDENAVNWSSYRPAGPDDGGGYLHWSFRSCHLGPEDPTWDEQMAQQA